MIVASSDDMTMPSTTVTDHSEVLPSGNGLSPPLSKGFEKREEIALLSTTAQADYIAGEVPRSITDDAFLQNKDPSFEDQSTSDDSRPRISSLDGASSAPRVPSVLNGTDTDANLRDQNSELHGQRDNRGANQDAVPTKTISFSDSPMEHTRDEEMKDSPLGINVNEEDGCTSIPAIGTNTSNDVTTMVEQRIVSVTNQSTHDQEPSRIEPEGATLLAAKHASRRFDDEMLKEVLLEEQLKIVPPVEAERKDLDLKEPQSMQEDHDHEQEEVEVEVASKEPPGTPAKLLNESHENGLEEETKLQVVEPPSPEIIEVPQQIEHYQPYSPFDTYSHRSAEYPRNHHVSENGLVAVSLAGPGPAPPPAQSFESNRQISPIPRAPIAAAHHTIMRSTSVQRTSIGTYDGNQHNGILYSQAEVGIPHLPALVLPAHSSHVSVPAPAAIPATGFPAINAQSMTQASNHFMNLAPGGKRRIHLRLVEDRTSSIMKQPEKSGFLSFRRRSILRNPIHSPISEMVESSPAQNQWIDHGSLTVSWYEGTSSLELQEHVRNSVSRKLGLKGSTKLADFRVLDESTDPPEEVVLCAYIPNGSRLLLRFTTKDSGDEDTPTRARIAEYYVGPPESPSAAPSPHPTSVDLEGLGLNANQLALLGDRLKGLQLPLPEDRDQITRLKQNFEARKPLPRVPSLAARKEEKNASQSRKDAFIDGHEKNSEDDEDNSKGSHMEVASLHPEDQIQKSLREITDILMAERSGGSRYAPRQEKRQVIFVLANYFVLFLSLIAISAEIQARAPTWHATMERQLQNVQDCSKDQESLFRCVENGDLAGLVASVLLWISRSAATKRIFLFGFESPKRLWTVVYESLVTAVCWGFSYMFIRRGMNPDTNRNFLQKYWKDAVYGSLAGFNAAFMKHVLKNLIPQEAIEDALQERQLKILSWLPSFSLK